MRFPRAILLSVATAAAAIAAFGCGRKSTGGEPSPSPTPSSTPCVRAPKAATRDRHVVVSRPYDVNANASSLWEVLVLSSGGALSRPGTTFTMGRATSGRIVFTPDGEIGIVAQEDGSLGVFRIDAAGVSVVDSAFHGSFYADRVVMGPDGTEALVIDPDTLANGGGIFRVAIGCDGHLTDAGPLATAAAPHAAAFLPNKRLFAASGPLLGAPAGSDAELLGAGAPPALLDAVDAFGDDLGIVSAVAITSGGGYALLADDNPFSGVPERIAVVRITGDTLTATQILSPVNDPADLASSPFDGTVLVSSAEGNALLKITFDPMATTSAFTNAGAIAHIGAAPQLPVVMVTVDRGSLAGRVLVGENLGVRQVDFAPGGQVTDLGLFSFGSGLEQITGALGVEP